MNLGASTEHPSSKPPADLQLQTLKAIQAYNSALPKARKAKDSLAEIAVQNVTATFTMRTEKKKKETIREMVTNYRTIGITDGCSGSEVDRYSIVNKQREIQRSASALKIAQLRKSFEQLIGAQSKPEEIENEDGYHIDNPFSSETLNRDISLSVYNTPKKLVEIKERPVITQDYLLRGIKGYKPPTAAAAEGEPAPEASAQKVMREPVLPEFEDGVAEMITKDATD